jgi:hypothetical protein
LKTAFKVDMKFHPGMAAQGKMRKGQIHGTSIAILAGCGAALVGWAAFLCFFTGKDNLYDLGWFFTLLGLAGTCVAAALSTLVIARIVREKGAFVFTRPVMAMLACPFMPLLGWTGALGMVYTDATPGSVFMFWAVVFVIGGFLAPLVTAGLLRMQKRAAVYAAAGAPGLIAAVLFALSGDYQNDRFFAMVLVLGSVTSAAALPALLAVLVSYRRKAKKLILGLVLWLVGTALLMGLLMGFYILYEVIYGIMHFRM